MSCSFHALIKSSNLLCKTDAILSENEDHKTNIFKNYRQNNKKITDPVEEDFLYGGMILEEMENEGKQTFKDILKKYELNTDMDENIKKAIKNVRKLDLIACKKLKQKKIQIFNLTVQKFDGAEKIEPKDVAEYLKKF